MSTKNYNTDLQGYTTLQDYHTKKDWKSDTTRSKRQRIPQGHLDATINNDKKKKQPSVSDEMRQGTSAIETIKMFAWIWIFSRAFHGTLPETIFKYRIKRKVKLE